MKNNVQPKQVLVVDDEFEVAAALVENLESLGDNYKVEMVNSAEEALTKVRNERYDLLITDYKMPDMNGLDLARAVRIVSPDTQVILMTAYGTTDIRNTVKDLELGGYIDKPFTMAQILKVVKRAVEYTQGEDPFRSGETSLEKSVDEHLKNLLADTNAICVLLLSSGGYLIETAGITKGLNAPGAGALVAANFVASAALAKLLGSNSTFKSSYHEGPDYNIYAYDINGELLLAVIFRSKVKPGAVWHYAKQTATTLAPLVEEQPQEIGDLSEDLSEVMDEEFEQLIDVGGDKDDGGYSLMSIEEAVASGLVSLELLNDDNHDE